MEVFLKTSTDVLGQLSVNPSEPVQTLKQLISAQYSLSPDLKLVHNDQRLDEGLSLEGNGVCEGAELLCLAPTEESLIFATLKGKQFTIIANHTEKISALKMKVQRLEGYKKDRQRLVHKGEILPDSELVGNCGLVTGATVELLMPDDKLIWVSDHQQRCCVYCLAKDSWDVRTLKRKVGGRIGLEESNLTLRFREQTLRDEDELGYFETSRENPVEILAATACAVDILRNNKTTTVYLPSFDATVEALKQQLESVFQIPVPKQILYCNCQELTDDQQPMSTILQPGAVLSLLTSDEELLIVNIYEGPTVIVGFPQTRTIKSVKNKLKRSSVHYRLFLDIEELRDECTLDEYKLVSKSEVSAITSDYQSILVKKMRNEEVVRVCLKVTQNTGRDLRDIIEKTCHIPRELQCIRLAAELIHDSTVIPKDANNMTVELSYLSDAYATSLRPSPSSCTNDETIRTVTLRAAKGLCWVETCRTVGELKAAVAARSEDYRSGCSLYRGQIALEEESVLLATLGIHNFQGVDILRPCDVRLWVKSPLLDSVSVITTANCRIAGIKQCLEQEWNFPACSVSLYNGDVKLVDSFTLADCGLQNDSVLSLRGNIGLLTVVKKEPKLKTKNPRRRRGRLSRLNRVKGMYMRAGRFAMRGRRAGWRARFTHRIPTPPDSLPAKEITVVVILIGRSPFRLSVALDATGLALKTLIAACADVEVCDIELRVGRKKLADKKTLAQQYVKNFDCVVVQTSEDAFVCISTETQRMSLTVSRRYTLKGLKDLIVDREDMVLFTFLHQHKSVDDERTVEELAGISSSLSLELRKEVAVPRLLGCKSDEEGFSPYWCSKKFRRLMQSLITP